MKVLLALIAALALSACASPNVQAPSPRPAPEQEFYLGANVTKTVSENGTYLVLHDEIEYETGTVVVAQINSGTIDGLILIDNVGGYVIPAQDIGYAVRYHGVTTGVVGGCYSACVDVFVAGYTRVASSDATFGIHAPSEEMYEADAEYYYTMGVPQMLKATYAVPNSDMFYFDSYEAVEYGIATHLGS